MFKKIVFALLLLPVVAWSQATTGYHRIAQVIARAPLNSVNAQVVPYATVTLTYTATGLAAAVYSDPLLSVGIPNHTLTADSQGNYNYYFALNTCITEVISTPDGGITIVPNVCSNGGGGSGGCSTSGATGTLQASNGSGGCQPAYVEVNGTPITTPTPVNFVDTATIKWTNPSAGLAAAAVIPGSTLPIKVNGTSVPDQNLLNFLSATPSIPGGDIAVNFTNDSGGGIGGYIVPPPTGPGFASLITPPVTGQNVIIYPTAHTLITGSNAFCGPTGAAISNNTSGVFTKFACNAALVPDETWGSTYFGWTLPSDIPAANVTAVYAVANAGYPATSQTTLITNPSASISCLVPTFSTYTLLSISNPASSPQAQFSSHLVSYGGSDIANLQCTAQNTSGSDPFPGSSQLNLASIALVVYYTGAPSSYTLNNINVDPPLFYRPATQDLGIDLSQPFPGSDLEPWTGATLPGAALWPGRIFNISDGPNCAGGGTTATLCISNGTVYSVFASGGSGGFPFTLGSTSIAASSTTTSVSGLAVNGVTLNAAGSTSLFLNQAGGYTTPPGSGLSGMTAGQVAIAGSGTTITSSIALGTTGSDIPQLSSGLLNNSVVNWAAPSAIGTGTPTGGIFSSLKDTGAAAGAGLYCLQVDTTGAITNTGFACGSAGGGVSTVEVNGGAGLTTANFGAAPAAGANGINVTWQNSGSTVSAEIVGDGNAAHFLSGLGTWTTPAASSVAFSAITGSTNTTAAMVVGAGATLGWTSTGTIDSTSIQGVAVSGTPGVGQVPTAIGSSAATWQTPSAGGSLYQYFYAPNCSVGGTTLNTFAVYASTGVNDQCVTTAGTGLASGSAGAGSGYIVGIVVAGQGTTGFAKIAYAGSVSCKFDAGTAPSQQGYYVSPSGLTGGDCAATAHSPANENPNTNIFYATVETTAGVGATTTVDLRPIPATYGNYGYTGPNVLTLMAEGSYGGGFAVPSLMQQSLPTGSAGAVLYPEAPFQYGYVNGALYWYTLGTSALGTSGNDFNLNMLASPDSISDKYPMFRITGSSYNVPSVASISGTVAIDVGATGGVYYHTLSGSSTYSCPTDDNQGHLLVFDDIQAASLGPYSVTWNGCFKNPPTVSSVFSSHTVSVWEYDGANYQCMAGCGTVYANTFQGTGSGPAILQLPQNTYAVLTATYTCNSGNATIEAWISDASTQVWGATVTGTGTPTLPYTKIGCDGSNWTVIGK